MQVQLTLLDRISILNIMPQDGSSWQTRQLVRDLTGKVGVTAEDQEEFEVVTAEPDASGRTNTRWNTKGAEQRPFDLHAKEIGLIHDALEKLDKAEKLLPQHDSLCEAFLDNPPKAI